MFTLRVCSALAILVALASCSTAARSAPTVAMDGRENEDALRLSNGEVVRGRIVEETARQVVIERENVVSTYPRAAIFSIDYSKDRWNERRQPLLSSDTPAASSRPSSTWLPRTDPREPIQQTEVLFHDSHALVDCVGPALAQAHQDLPDLRLFVEPGGKIVLHDPKQWGYHAHLPGGALRIPVGKPGLSIDLPKDEAALPETIVFVSPAQEIKAGDGDARTSYALPDAVSAVIKPISIAETMLAIQPFAGGRPLTTPNGPLWAFTLPRNSRQFFVYLLDRTRKHGEILKASYVGFGDTVLAADLIVDLIGADGVALGRVLAVPYPDQLSADGPAREPLVVYAGPLKDPTAIATLALPPREAIQLPSRPSSTKADVLVSHYEVSPSVPQSSVLAYGVGRPTRDVTIVTREITPKDPDQVVKIDLSSLPEERFPAVLWLYQRRTFVWKTTGGRFLPGTPAEVPALGDVALAKLKRSEAIPHVIPLIFTGPKASSGGGRGLDPAAGVAGGMANGLLHDALSKEAGGLRSLTQTISSPAPSGDGGVSNVTYVYISSPPHSAAAELGGFGGAASSATPGGLYLNSAGGPAGGFAPAEAYGNGGYAMRPSGSINSSGSGSVSYDPRTGSMSGGGQEPLSYTVSGVTMPVRRTRR
ncbi:MAG TPA: hypothetical protein VNM14_15705 [Planctomycetota bacterium]|nr:hypothetical protein [Planctomycetota bacterium]